MLLFKTKEPEYAMSVITELSKQKRDHKKENFIHNPY